jgi:hypothetical protein
MNDETKIAGTKSSHQMITPACRSGRGIDGAFIEAVARVRKSYEQYAGSKSNDEVTWHIVLVREEGSQIEEARNEPTPSDQQGTGEA